MPLPPGKTPVGLQASDATINIAIATNRSVWCFDRLLILIPLRFDLGDRAWLYRRAKEYERDRFSCRVLPPSFSIRMSASSFWRNIRPWMQRRDGLERLAQCRQQVLQSVERDVARSGLFSQRANQATPTGVSFRCARFAPQTQDKIGRRANGMSHNFSRTRMVVLELL